MKRNHFLLGAISGVTVAASNDSFFAKALAQPALPGMPGSAGERVLVLLNLVGGNDGLNMIVPHGTPEYYRYRPTIAVPPSDVLTVNEKIGFNPALRSLKALYDRGEVAIVQGSGYPSPDHSHFRSQQIWQTAAPESYESTGWIGRYLDGAALPKENLWNGVAIAEVLPEAMVGRSVDVPALSDVRSYGLRSDRRLDDRNAFTSLLSDQRVPFSSPYLAAVTQIEAHAQRGSEQLPKLIAGYRSTASYPATPLGRSLALAAQIIGSRLGTRVIYVQHGSFDTHSSQKRTQDILLEALSNALVAFYDDLQAHGNDRRVLTMTFSEFGRRVAENASRGTDHGEAGPMLLVGGGVKGGVYGEHPRLDQLDNGDAIYTTDFRSVYTTVVERWLGRAAHGIVGGSFPLIPVRA
ncbi:MAG: DUF1501 domain-containing protein [Candidatus Eremiobacteraeota bacterium]|nr:DUF1501 domain-containing protein [Candidatus Eremiobacteraeota bacterium]